MERAAALEGEVALCRESGGAPQIPLSPDSGGILAPGQLVPPSLATFRGAGGTAGLPGLFATCEMAENWACFLAVRQDGKTAGPECT